jgi:hypothetical protein
MARLGIGWLVGWLVGGEKLQVGSKESFDKK